MMALFKVALVLMVAALSTCAIGTVAAGAYLVSGGVAGVHVDTPDVDLHIPVPMRVVDLGLGVASLAAPDRDELISQIDLPPEQLAQLRPMLRRLAREVSNMPDGELVRVKTRDEDVRISQSGGRFRIDVDTPDAQVHVSVPKRAAGRLLNQLASF